MSSLFLQRGLTGSVALFCFISLTVSTAEAETFTCVPSSETKKLDDYADVRFNITGTEAADESGVNVGMINTYRASTGEFVGGQLSAFSTTEEQYEYGYADLRYLIDRATLTWKKVREEGQELRTLGYGQCIRGGKDDELAQAKKDATEAKVKADQLKKREVQQGAQTAEKTWQMCLLTQIQPYKAPAAEAVARAVKACEPQWDNVSRSTQLFLAQYTKKTPTEGASMLEGVKSGQSERLISALKQKYGE